MYIRCVHGEFSCSRNNLGYDVLWWIHRHLPKAIICFRVFNFTRSKQQFDIAIGILSPETSNGILIILCYCRLEVNISPNTNLMTAILNFQNGGQKGSCTNANLSFRNPHSITISKMYMFKYLPKI